MKTERAGPRAFVEELRRRRVLRVVAVYAAGGWIVVEAAATTFPLLSLPAWAPTLVLVLVLAGFPLAVGMAWAYQVTPGGLVRERPAGEARSRQDAMPGSAVEGIDRRPGLLVLPFDNLSPSPDDGWFSDGLTDEIITGLSRLRKLRVISRSTAMVVKGRGSDVRTIGRELDVRYVLEGSVRKAGDDVRITAQLIDARTDAHLWSERHGGTMADVFDVQERIARQIVDALEVELTPGERDRLSARPIQDAHAYEAYLRARQQTWEWTPEALDRARQQMKNGLALVGPNPLFHAGLAYVYFQYANLGIENEDYIRQAEDCARQALELDRGSAEAHLVLALLYQAFKGDQRTSFRHFSRALERNPDDPHALLWWIVGHTLVGKAQEARSLVERLRRVDPLTPVVRYIPVFVDVWAGRLDHSVDELSTWFRLEPDNHVALFFSAMGMCFEGWREEARCILAENLKAERSDVFSSASRLLSHALRPGPKRSEPALPPNVETACRRDPQISYLLADIHALAERRHEALDWLENAVDRGFCNHPFMTVHDPLLEPIRGTSEFARIATRAHEEWLTFDA